MNPFSFIRSALGLVPDIVSAIGAIARAARSRPEPKPLQWTHYWVFEDYNAPPPHVEICQWCKRKRAQAEGTPCKGP